MQWAPALMAPHVYNIDLTIIILIHPLEQHFTPIPVKAAIAVGINHRVSLMMTASAATPSGDNTTSGLGSAVVWVVAVSKNSRSHFKLILCCFSPMLPPNNKTIV